MSFNVLLLFSLRIPKHIADNDSMAPNDTAYKRWSCHSELKLLCKLCRTSPPPAMGDRFTVFWACRPCGPAGWLALLLTKAGDVETNPGPTTPNKKVWICDICHKQIHVRKQISAKHNTQIPGKDNFIQSKWKGLNKFGALMTEVRDDVKMMNYI